MLEITVTEGANDKYDATLKYSHEWSTSAKRGTPVLTADVTTVYFQASATESGAAWLTLSSASSSEIAWLSATTGEIRIKFGGTAAGKTTEGFAGSGQWYEIRLLMADGSFTTAERGRLNVLNSIVDTP